MRLKAIQAIEGTSDKASVTVNVNSQTNVAAIAPGYIIRLPAGAPLPAIEQEREPVTIKASRAVEVALAVVDALDLTTRGLNLGERTARAIGLRLRGFVFIAVSRSSLSSDSDRKGRPVKERPV